MAQTKAKRSPAAAKRALEAAKKRAVRESLHDVGQIPSPADWDRRNACESDLALFIRTYGVGFERGTFDGRLYPAQEEQIRDIQRAIDTRGCYAFTNFRGGGKTGIINAARVWLVLYGHARWVVTLFASKDATINVRDSLVSEFLDNGLLAADFPEVSACMRHCDGKGQLLRSQVCEGVPTGMRITESVVIMPDVRVSAPWQRCAGSVCEFTSCGTGALRGKQRSGVRPDVVFLDDIESDDSADSDAMSARLEQTLDTVAGLGSHLRDVACVWIGTVISAGCLMDRYSNPLLNPSWHGKRYRYMVQMPLETRLWERYVELRRDPAAGGAEAARAFYRANREAMLRGAVAAWPEGYDSSKYDDAIEKYFAQVADKGARYAACELQNDPAMLLTDEDRAQLDLDSLLRRTSGLPRGHIPDEAVGLCAFVDMQEPHANPLYWQVDWFNTSFGGGLYAHGTWPLDGSTPIDHYSRSLQRAVGREEALSLAASELVAYLKGMDRRRANGTQCPLAIAADTGDGVHQSVAFALARQEGLVPTKGMGLKTQEVGSGRNTKAKQRGQDWYTSYQTDANGVVAEVLNYESRRWKCFVRDRMQSPPTTPSSWLLWGRDGTVFRDLCRHYCNETSREIATPEGGRYTTWTANGASHWWDCHVGCHVLASYAFRLVLRVEGGLVRPPAPKRRRQPFKLNVVPV